MYGNFNRYNGCNNCSRNNSNCGHSMNNCSRNNGNCSHSMNNCSRNNDNCGHSMNNCSRNNGNCGHSMNNCSRNNSNCGCSMSNGKNDCCDKRECANSTLDYSEILNNLCDNKSECVNNKVCCGSNYNRRNKEELWQIITQSSFALDDIKLFLDTHPCNREALKAYEEYKNIRRAALMEYGTKYGPISAYDVKVCDSWDWINNPWPWEGEC